MLAQLLFSPHALDRARERHVPQELLDNQDIIIEEGVVIPPKYISIWTKSVAASREPAVHVCCQGWTFVIETDDKTVITVYESQGKQAAYVQNTPPKKYIRLRDIIGSRLQLKMWAV